MVARTRAAAAGSRNSTPSSRLSSSDARVRFTEPTYSHAPSTTIVLAWMVGLSSAVTVAPAATSLPSAARIAGDTPLAGVTTSSATPRARASSRCATMSPSDSSSISIAMDARAPSIAAASLGRASIGDARTCPPAAPAAGAPTASALKIASARATSVASRSAIAYSRLRPSPAAVKFIVITYAILSSTTSSFSCTRPPGDVAQRTSTPASARVANAASFADSAP